ncbi:Ribosomal RNA small subunit methyltransferase E [Eubacterium plexicaudatum ASF492]|uniref:Ribosomal RNA small subunit methyltransferase E n=1 Tax=Eubacterium plexicaudatum ASF492 TaxID=1235802 RepID=N2BDH1_9FIRM|nr:Ribosomal RNA small subunit methyltransferase E [Eubacterium plexicaudatum ASF492]
MYQFFVKQEQVGKDFITITGPDVNHMKNVLRMKPGEIVRVSSTDGHDYRCGVLELTDTFVQLDILDSDIAGTELSGRIYLFQALPKGDRMETVIQKAVELGVYAIIPVSMKYCVVKLNAQKAQAKAKRWQAIAESAAKQSKRSRIPIVRPVMDFGQAVSCAMECDCRLVPYENESGMRSTAEAFRSIKAGESISVMIGPEGGFAPEEIAAVREHMRVLSLGKRILRTDTAAVTMLSALMLHLEMMESAAMPNQVTGVS